LQNIGKVGQSSLQWKAFLYRNYAAGEVANGISDLQSWEGLLAKTQVMKFPKMSSQKLEAGAAFIY
jgi:hypothetical protein